MNVFYEEEGALKVGAVLADNVTSLQVEAPHGKRSKIKSANVLLRFGEPGIGISCRRRSAWPTSSTSIFCGNARAARSSISRRSPANTSGGHPPRWKRPAWRSGCHGAPMYFYKRGRGRYKAAPADALKAALASVERKKQQALQKEAYVAQLTAGKLPAEFDPVMHVLLYKPDRNSIEWKALEEAAAALKLAPARLIERCGALPSTHDYHLRRFLFEHFPRGAEPLPCIATPPEDLPLSDAAAFSIDDATTTEIDDAFSVTPLANGNVRVGIHIAAPAPAETPRPGGAERQRRTGEEEPAAATGNWPMCGTVRMRGSVAVRRVLARHLRCSRATRIERVRIVENLRHDALEPLFNEATLAHPAIDHRHGAELKQLWHWAAHLEHARLGDAAETEQRPEYTFRVENDRVVTRAVRSPGRSARA